MRRKATKADTAHHGNRYNKDIWEPVVRKMMDAGSTYGQIAKMLNTSHSTITRYVWQLGLASHDKHRHAVRARILKNGNHEISRQPFEKQIDV